MITSAIRFTYTRVAAPVVVCVQVCGGAVLRCLTDKRQELSSESCKHEVFYFTKMEVTDYRCACMTCSTSAAGTIMA